MKKDLKTKNTILKFFKNFNTTKLVFLIVFILFFLYSLTLIMAFVWALFSALKTHDEFVMHKFSLPTKWLFKNFIDAFTMLKVGDSNMIVMLFNSLWYTIGGTIISIVCSSCLAYVVSKYKFFGRNLIYYISLIIMLLPIVGSLPASYKLIYTLGLNDSAAILLTFTGGFGFNFIVLYGFFQNLSWSYAEAAMVDGAKSFYIFRKIMLPQAAPAMFSLMILASIGIWNDYMTPLLYMPSMPTISLGIYIFEKNMIYNANYPALFAGMLLSMVPILIIFVVFQETIMSNVVAGGLKG